MMLVHTAMDESADEMNSIVGLHWLPVFPHTQKVRCPILVACFTYLMHLVCHLLVSESDQ
jgi:hypothetical protein